MAALTGATRPPATSGLLGPSRRFAGLHLISWVVMIVLLAATVFASVAIHVIIDNQDSSLLTERADEVDLVLTSSIDAIPTTLETLGQIARNSGVAAFAKEAHEDVETGPGQLTFALVRHSSSGLTVVAASGSSLSVGSTVSAEMAAAVRTAMRHAEVIASPVIGTGSNRLLAIAVSGPDVPAGTAVLRLSELGPVKAPRQADLATFHELQVVIYDSPSRDQAQVLSTTTPHLPLRGSVRYIPLDVGTSRWLLGVSSMHPLVGSVAGSSPWVALASGALGTVLVITVLEQVIRRRDAAVALYRTEARLAETLQRKLLPHLPNVPGLDVASRYVAASDDQQVGGDWFDLFDLEDSRTVLVIGDVVGHDIEAAAAMAQIRAGLRAYALEGVGPAVIIDRLAKLVDTFAITGLTSVLCGVLDPPGSDGTRTLRWANAGHLPPVLNTVDGETVFLRDATSPVVGAPTQIPRLEAARSLPLHSTLILYTDGLVELPGVPLGDSLEQMRHALDGPHEGWSANDFCEALLHTRTEGPTRDDIAIVAVRILSDPRPGGQTSPPSRGWRAGAARR
jgi:serine phosphatase RsbU (regulator of sigma subunit)